VEDAVFVLEMIHEALKSGLLGIRYQHSGEKRNDRPRPGIHARDRRVGTLVLCQLGKPAPLIASDVWPGEAERCVNGGIFIGLTFDILL
jgi:hypothetical protein